ncbi:MAG: 2-hydroxyacyl-CoA dehydratase family protein [Pseudomonadota bacterium]
MEPDRIERQKMTIKKRLHSENRETLKRIEQIGESSPEAMQYFYDVFTHWDNPAVLDGNKPVIAISCMQVPLELILACNALPLRLCNGSHALEQAGSEFLPVKTCSIVKATVGLVTAFQEQLKDRLVLVVVPTTCDQKRKAIETLSEGAFKIYSLEVPPSKDTEEAAIYWRNSVKKLILALEKATGIRITKRNLTAAINGVRQASAQFRRLSRMQQHNPTLLYGKDMFMVMSTFLFDDINRWTAAVARLNDELEVRKQHGIFAGKGAPRMLLTGSPPMAPGFKLPLLLEEAGAVIVADEVCSCSRLLHDTVAYGEWRLYDMIPAVADRYLKPCTCPVFDSGEDRRRKLSETVHRFDVDGVVYQSYSGCFLYQMEERGVSNSLRGADIPMLFVETDYSTEDRGQLTTRLEAFVESIRSRKRRK